MKSSFLGELQNQLDTWCQNLGSPCNDRRFARHDGQDWRCWTNVVTDTSIDSCVSDDKTMVKCGSRGTGGRYCTRNDEILKLIHDFTTDETVDSMLGQPFFC